MASATDSPSEESRLASSLAPTPITHGAKGALAWSFERMNELRYFRRDTQSPTETGWTTELSGPAHPFHRSFNPGWAVGIGFDDLKVIEAAQFLQAVATGVQGPPSFEDAAAVARVQQAIAASWDSPRLGGRAAR